MNKNTIYLIVAIIVIAVGAWFWMGRSSNVPAGEQGNAVTGADDTASINQDMNNIAVEDPDFKSIDADLNSL